MPTPRVIDLSHHNTIPQDLKAAAQSGIVGCIHKLTEGATYVDSKVKARYSLCKDAGIAWGIYHFMRPGNMETQAEFFVSTAASLGVIDPWTCVVADHEDEKVPAADLKKWLDLVEDMTGRSPIVYSGHVLKDQLKGKGYRPTRRLWLCQYTSGTPSLPEGVDKYWLWQYSDKGSVPGINSPVDVNHFDVPVGDFLDSWAGMHENPPAPTPEPEPEPTQVPIVTISSDMPVQIVIGKNVEVVQ